MASKSNFPEVLGKPNEVSARMKNQSKLVEPTPYYAARTIAEFKNDLPSSKED